MVASNPFDAPANSAALLMDLQYDFLDANGRMPVGRLDAEAVIAGANAVLSGQVLRGILPISIVNRFPPSAVVANLFRHNAAIAGSPGAEIDQRVLMTPDLPVFAKQSSSAFNNSELEGFLRAREIRTLFVLGVYAEGCVRATVADALRLGFEVIVAQDAIGTNANWKRRFALWSMRRNGASSMRIGVSR